MPLAVRVVGLAHGILFVAYVGLVIEFLAERRWQARKAAWAVLAALLPFGPFVFHAKHAHEE
jgi:integral membrane protein